MLVLAGVRIVLRRLNDNSATGEVKMPIYEYRCIKGHVTEVRQTSYDPAKIINCPECAKDMSIIISKAHLIVSRSDFEIKNKPIGEKKWDI